MSCMLFRTHHCPAPPFASHCLVTLELTTGNHSAIPCFDHLLQPRELVTQVQLSHMKPKPPLFLIPENRAREALPILSVSSLATLRKLPKKPTEIAVRFPLGSDIRQAAPPSAALFSTTSQRSHGDV
ncbi:hypothetical protein CIPAW_08G115700 [Carya illinoinensis]|uniref:Uncharacterized protein n=1 Tax=Carya illinoinensis TaxID=32201 RepID=A0A8T1PVG0_CARIL|nr:hypothetical protein CIPAW_08G115700 [Carya illinoinensis]KAG6645338.1 hypothetical protein CIPAW_08G115700 [Carya illinoinensis]